MSDDEWLPRLRGLVLACDQSRLDALLLSLVFAGVDPHEVEAAFRTAVDEAPWPVHRWWHEDCNCDGHLN